MADDILYRVDLTAGLRELALTAHFNGGPIGVVIDAGPEKETHTFPADPYFRLRNHYIANCSLLFRIPEPLPVGFQRVIVSVQFANMFAEGAQPSGGAHFNLQLTAFGPPANPRVPVIPATDGPLAFSEFQNVIILISRP